MRQQEQLNNSKWYSNTYVLVILFLALYVVIPMLLVLFNDEFKKFLQSEYTKLAVLGFALFCLISIIIKIIITVNKERTPSKNLILSALNDFFSENTHYWDNVVETAIAATIVNNICDNNSILAALNVCKYKCILSNESIVNGVNETIKNALKDKKVTEEIKKALHNSSEMEKAVVATLRNDSSNIEGLKAAIARAIVNNSKVKNAISAALKVDSLAEIIKTAINEDSNMKNEKDIINKNDAMEKAKNAINDALNSSEVKLALNTVIKDNVVTILEETIKSDISICLKKAINSEKDAQKYRFAERMVGEICKNNSKPSANEITEIRKLIGGIIGPISEKYCLEVLEDGNVTIIHVNDDGRKTLLLRFNNDDQSLTAISSKGSFIFGDMLQVTINDDKAIQIKKLPITDTKKESEGQSEEQSRQKGTQNRGDSCQENSSQQLGKG